MHDKRVHRGPDVIGHLALCAGGRDEQLDALGLVPAEPPVPARGRREPHRRLRLTRRERAAHRRTDVVVLDLERGEPAHLLGAAQVRIRGLGEFGEVAEMRLPSQVRFPSFH